MTDHEQFEDPIAGAAQRGRAAPSAPCTPTADGAPDPARRHGRSLLRDTTPSSGCAHPIEAVGGCVFLARVVNGRVMIEDGQGAFLPSRRPMSASRPE